MPVFGAVSLKNLSRAHPKLQEILQEAIKVIDFRVLDSTRGRDAQNRAYAAGNSKAKFGQSAHNWTPAIAVDLFPAPYDWKATKAFHNLAGVILPIAKRLEIPIRWGGDWNMDGNTSDGWDLPHYELHPWRTWSKSKGVKPYDG